MNRSAAPPPRTGDTPTQRLPLPAQSASESASGRRAIVAPLRAGSPAPTQPPPAAPSSSYTLSEARALFREGGDWGVNPPPVPLSESELRAKAAQLAGCERPQDFEAAIEV